MSKRWMSIGMFFVLIAVAAIWMRMPATHAATPGAEPAAGITCGSHHCAPGKICCPNCATGEPQCSNGPRCPECAPR